MDREKVIKGLECCTHDTCVECPYKEEKCCTYWQPFPNMLLRDTLELLKAQEPKLVRRWPTKEMSPYCPNIEGCGKPLEEGWAYCPYCGQVVKWDG